METHRRHTPSRRFSLRVLFLVMTLLCAYFAYHGYKWAEKRRFTAIATGLEERGFTVFPGARGCPSTVHANALGRKIIQVRDEDVKLIGQLKYLEHLDLCVDPIGGAPSGITDDSLRHLQKLRELKSLFIAKAPVTDEGIKHLRSLRSLERLYLVDTEVTDAGLEYLAEMTNLKILGLAKTHVTAEGVRSLSEKLPDCEITFSNGAVKEIEPDRPGS